MLSEIEPKVSATGWKIRCGTTLFINPTTLIDTLVRGRAWKLEALKGAPRHSVTLPLIVQDS